VGAGLAPTMYVTGLAGMPSRLLLHTAQLTDASAAPRASPSATLFHSLYAHEKYLFTGTSSLSGC
jgi:hypothetical protein